MAAWRWRHYNIGSPHFSPTIHALDRTAWMRFWKSTRTNSTRLLSTPQKVESLMEDQGKLTWTNWRGQEEDVRLTTSWTYENI